MVGVILFFDLSTGAAMNNWVLVLYVITFINQHDYREAVYAGADADTHAAYPSKMDCEAALQKDPPQYGTDVQCTPFRANMGPISTLYFCRGCTEEQSAEAMKGVGGRVQVTRDDWQ
jgi:hypothetical protein